MVLWPIVISMWIIANRLAAITTPLRYLLRFRFRLSNHIIPSSDAFYGLSIAKLSA